MSGTVSMDLFMAVPNASSALLESGLAAIAQGAKSVRIGSGVLRGGAYAVVAVAGFAASYAATSYALCAINPEYGR
jgi:DNA gyrase inhibitor GyrI